MKNLTALLPFFFLVLLSDASLGQDYFWVGNSGNWSDLGHWATSSGGSEFHTELPGPENDVYLDENSFSLPNQELVLNEANMYCRDFITTGVQNGPLITTTSNTNALRPFGDVVLDPGLFRDFGWIVMSNEGGEAYLTTSNIGLGANAAVYFGGETSADFYLTDSLSCSRVGPSRGRFFTQNNPIYCADAFTSNFGPYREAHLGTSRIHTAELTINSNMVMEAGEATFYIGDEGFTNGRFWGSGFTYGEVYFQGNVDVTGSSFFGSFTVLDGSEIVLEEGSTQSAGQFNFEGTEDNAITLISSNAGSEAFIVQTSGAVLGNHMNIRDNNAGGGATFTADNSVDLGNNTGWEIIEDIPLNFYWIGGSGDWSDEDHWSSESGGLTSIGSLPSLQDTVIIDILSFDTPGTLTIDQDGFCADFRVLGDVEATIEADAVLHIYGNTELNGTTVFNLDDVAFEGGNGPYTITSNGADWGPGSSLIFQVGGFYDFTDDLIAGQVNIDDGTVLMEDITVELGGQIRTQAVGDPYISLNNSTANIAFWRPYAPGEENYNLNGAVFNISNQFDCGGMHYDEVNLLNNQIYLYSSGSFDLLTLSPGMNLIMESGETFEVNELIAIGTADNMISISATDEGDEAFFEGNGSDVTGEYLELQDNHAVGTATFTAVNSDLLDNVDGWNIPEFVAETLTELNIYPNPAEGRFFIKSDQRGTLRIFTLEGRDFMNLNVTEGLNSIDCSGWPLGVYLLFGQDGSSSKLVLE